MIIGSHLETAAPIAHFEEAETPEDLFDKIGPYVGVCCFVLFA